MIQCVERRVYVFKTKDVLPTEEDSFRGYVIALTRDGFWIGIPVAGVQANPKDFPQWMQYPDLGGHIEIFDKSKE